MRIYLEEFATAIVLLAVCAVVYYALVGAFDYHIDGWYCLVVVGWMLGNANGAAGKRLRIEGEKAALLAELADMKQWLAKKGQAA